MPAWVGNRNALVHTQPRLAAARSTARSTARDPELGLAIERYLRRVILSVIGIIARPGPNVGAVRAHVDQNLHAKRRAVALSWIGIAYVLAGVRYGRRNIAAERAAATVNANRRRAVRNLP